MLIIRPLSNQGDVAVTNQMSAFRSRCFDWPSRWIVPLDPTAAAVNFRLNDELAVAGHWRNQVEAHRQSSGLNPFTSEGWASIWPWSVSGYIRQPLQANAIFVHFKLMQLKTDWLKLTSVRWSASTRSSFRIGQSKWLVGRANQLNPKIRVTSTNPTRWDHNDIVTKEINQRSSKKIPLTFDPIPLGP